jgi:hypothetical protein
MSALKLTEQEILATVACPGCFGPQPPNSNQYPESTKDRLIICLDGNFQHCHHSKASCEEVIRTPAIFLEQREVDSMLADIRLAEIKNKPLEQVRSFVKLTVTISTDILCALHRLTDAPIPTKQLMIRETNQHGRAVMTQA